MSLRNVRYVHTNLIAQDWKSLATFYQTVFGCIPVPPKRDLHGPWLDRATHIENAHLRGIHLRLPGWGEDGPTLEIFQYGHMPDPGQRTANRPGLAHLAFAVDDVEAACQAVLAEGGGRIGDIVTLEIPNAGSVTFAYMTDPEGNLIEIQSWQ